jgi:hypothetical protein
MGPFTLWQEPQPGRPMYNNITLDAGNHTFSPGCRGCAYARSGWDGAYWTVIAPDGTTLAGGETAGQVTTMSGQDVCESGAWFGRFSQSGCTGLPGLTASCCRWNPTADLGVAGTDSDGNGLADATEGGGGQCESRVGDGSCTVDSSSTFTVPADMEVIVMITIPQDMDNTFVVEWQVDDGGFGMEGPIRAPLFMGMQNEGDDESNWRGDQGFAGSIAGIKTFSEGLRPTAAECIFQEAETEVGICESVDSVIYEATFTASGQGANDPERDLNGPVTGGVATIAQCLAMSAKTKVPIFVACRGRGGSRQGRITRRPSTPTRAAPPVT